MIMDSMLLCCGESGYRQVAVKQVYRRCGACRSQFYSHFTGKAECFEAAYAEQAERLFARLHGIGKQPHEGGLGAALTALGHFVSAEPARAKAMFVEVHVAGGGALAKRREVLERFSSTLDSACRHDSSSQLPPPMTGEFMVCVVDQAVSTALLRGEPDQFAKHVPELAKLVSEAYRAGD